MSECREHRHLGNVPQTDDCVPDMFQRTRLDFPCRGHLDRYRGKWADSVLAGARFSIESTVIIVDQPEPERTGTCKYAVRVAKDET